MNVALFSFASLLTALIIHLLWWRIRLPKAQTRTLLVIFFGFLPAALLIGVCLPDNSPLRLHHVWQYAQFGLFYCFLSLAYIEFYTAIEGESPSCTVRLFVRQAGDKGRAEQELLSVIDDDFIVGQRLQAMVDGGFVAYDGKYRLTWLGRLWARIFQFTRWIYHLELGG